jgi:hypothetical protein
MKKYFVGNCIGCGNRTAGAVVTGDRSADSEHVLEMVESGHNVRMLVTDKQVGVESCVC